MKPFCFVFVLFSLGIQSYAQEEFVPPQAKLLVRLPFTQLSGGIVIIKAVLDNHPDSLNFVFDTGSGGISLDSTTVMYLNLTRTKTEKSQRR